MNTKYVMIDENNINWEAIAEAGRILRNGGLVAFPTETVYGLGGDALNPKSSEKIYAAKGRPSDNPLIVHIGRWEDIRYIVSEIPPEAEKLAKAYWPGPLTMIFPKSELVPYETTGGLDTVAVRMPGNKTALALIEAAGGYVAAPSANTSGKPSPTLAKYVKEDMDGRIDMILDGGPVGIGLESTIVDMTADRPEILRPGYITREMLSAVIGEVAADHTMMGEDSSTAPKAPGMKYKHYAPQGELTIVSGSEEHVVARINAHTEEWKRQGVKTGIIGTDNTLRLYHGDVVKSAGSRQDESSIARTLYRILREMDEEEVKIIYSEAFDTGGMGQAIMNRLLKAAAYHVECV